MATPITIPLSQKAAILEAHNAPYVVKTDHPVKKPSELATGECLIKMEYTGVCHSDLHIRNADWANKSKLPLIGGHEGIGRVVAIGAHSGSTVKIGDRVGVKWIGNVCGQCVMFIYVTMNICSQSYLYFRCEMCRKGHESCGFTNIPIYPIPSYPMLLSYLT